MYEILNSFKQRPIPNISTKTHQFWKTLKFFKNPKTYVSKHEMHVNERLETHQVKNKTWENHLRVKFGVSKRILGSEKTSLSREWTRKMRGKSRFALKSKPSKSRQIEVSRQVSSQVSRKQNVDKCSCRGRIHQTQLKKLDRSTSCREAIEIA